MSLRSACLTFMLTLCLSLGGAAARAASDNPFIAAAFDREKIDQAIASQAGLAPLAGVSGILVPHHLLAADLIARGFQAASGGNYDRIIVLSPDHFRAVSGGFATTRAGFETIYGKVAADTEAANALAASSDLISVRGDFGHEHGLVALMPFVKHFFPGTPVVVLVSAIDTTEQQWRAAADALAGIITARTLIIQSTDFSHYLPRERAVLRDQETLSLIAAGDADAVAGLVQPDHLDSKASLYLQMRLQSEIFGSRAAVIANRNSAEYGGDAGNTTSYITAVFVKDSVSAGGFAPDDQSLTYFGGDVLLGRYMTPLLLDPRARTAVLDALKAATGGHPLVVNLEGVILEEPVAGLWDEAHLMLREIAVPMLKDMGVVAAGLANNHSRDLGTVGLQETQRILRQAGIAPLLHGGEAADLGPLRVLAANFVEGRDIADAVYRTPQEAAAACDIAAAPPLVALVHWGAEYTDAAGDAERAAARVLAGCGVQAIAGAHSHQASPGIETVPGGAANMTFSLGNLLFDQRGDRASGALMEIRVFAQGTAFARLVPVPNLFSLGSAQLTDAPAN